ncbi:MAG TPA: DUF998 domain-containing protein [Ktedonobacterales bacterium]|nr:DUF998 domain-containing protein [Ktedonobacterales bacterium]
MVVENRQAADYSPVTSLLIACGAIGPILFVIVFLIEGATRPGYSAWHNFVSDLSESSLGWIQIASFLVCGALVFCFALGLRRVFRSGRGAVWGPLLLGAFGLSLIVAGVFVTDPSLGYYPLGSPAGVQTPHGTIHGVTAPVVFGLLTSATFVFARRLAHDSLWRGWGVYSFVTGAVCVVTFIACLATAVLDEHGVLPNSPTGLLERIAIIVGWGWIALLAIRLLRQMRPSPDAKA